MAEGKFPKFNDADVAILLSGIRSFRLHAGVLRRSGQLFHKLLSEENAAGLTAKARREGRTIRWRLDLKCPDDGIGFLVLVEIDSHGRSPAVSTPYDNENARSTPRAFEHWENLFRAFYNEPLCMVDGDMTSTLVSGVGILDVAEYCDSVSVISATIDHALLRHGQTLFQSIASNPLAWSNLAMRLKSRIIFKESLIHLVGRRREFSPEDMSELDEKTRDICEVKFYDLEVRKKAMEMRILGHYPALIIAEAHKNPSRAQYANDIYMWLAMSLFRHWFAQSILERQGRAPIDGCFCFYRQLATAGQAYLSREQCDEFHRFFPMTGRGKTAFEANLTLYKSEIARFVKPLMENKTQLIPETAATLGHLVCVDVEEKDYPWVEVADEEPAKELPEQLQEAED